MEKIYNIRIAGEAGFGIMSAGTIISKLIVRASFYTFVYPEYPSLIRGGHNVVQVSASSKVVNSQHSKVDLLIALNQESIDRHINEIKKNGIVLYDSNRCEIPKNNKNAKSIKKIGIPLTDLVRTIKAPLIVRNTIAIGAFVALTGIDPNSHKKIINEKFKNKKTLLKLNLTASSLGIDFIEKHHSDKLTKVFEKNNKQSKNKKSDNMLLTGNQAIALAAIAARMQFVAIYPMTPTSNILHMLAKYENDFDYVCKQPEDEISAINMAIGASFAGARSMVATSGGGFSLMSEAYGLAGITETPLVIIEGMRGAPATGLPTWTEQGDLRFVLHAHQGDFARVVLAAGDVEEAFDLTFKAFNLADIYQTPVVVLVDKYVCESAKSIKVFDLRKLKVERGKLLTKTKRNYKRYKIVKNGISERAIAGSGNFFVANSDEHDEHGFSNEEVNNRTEQMKKRMQKLATLAKTKKDLVKPKLYGDNKADCTILSWGSNKGPILEALKYLENVNYVHNVFMNPLPIKELQKLTKNAHKIILFECNYTSQYGSLIEEQTNIKINKKVLKYDGRPFYPQEIVEHIKRL